MANTFVFSALENIVVSSTSRSLSTLRDTVRRNLLNDSDYYTNTDIDNAINRAYRKLAEETLAYTINSDQNTVIGTYLYSTPANKIQVLQVIYDNFRLEHDSISTFLNLYSTTTSPTAYVGIPNKWADYMLSQIWLCPTPQNVKTLSILYAGYPDELVADGDVSVFVKRGDDFLINFATGDLLLRDNELNKSAIYDKKSREDLDHTKRLTKNKPMFNDRSRDYDYYGGF